MKLLLNLEDVAIFIFCIYLFSLLNFAWWIFPSLLFLPDIGMLGYLINTKIGAYSYNFFHHRMVAIAVGFIGLYQNNHNFMLVGIILFAHISFDRIFGYGLKFNDSFHHTHLGNIGKGKA